MASAEPYAIQIDERAAKELAKAVRKNKPLQEKLTDAIRDLATDRQSSVKRLTGLKPALYRKRVDDWRIIFAQSKRLRIVTVFAVRRRREDTYDQGELQEFSFGLSADYD